MTSNCRECGAEMDGVLAVEEHLEGCPLRSPEDPFEGLDEEGTFA